MNFETAVVQLLLAGIVYLLLRAEFARQLKLMAARSKRCERSYRMRTSKDLESMRIITGEASATARETSETVDKALRVVEDMGRRFDAGEKPHDPRPVTSLTELRKRSEDRIAEKRKSEFEAVVRQ